MHVLCMQSNDKNSKIQLWKGINLLYLPFLHSILVFLRLTLPISHVWPCIIAFGKEWTTKCGKHGRFNRFSWWNFCPTHLVSQVFMFINHIKAYCSMGVSVFINNVEWDVNLKYKGWYFVIAMQKHLLWWEIRNIIIHSHNKYKNPCILVYQAHCSHCLLLVW